ncbi:MAG: hypothetical protein LBN30_10010 [Oscillospiraceae bacterium]|jgi:hypothetical protein|nr:hypothetical protein [Oscillospiraceae bacterium]
MHKSTKRITALILALFLALTPILTGAGMTEDADVPTAESVAGVLEETSAEPADEEVSTADGESEVFGILSALEDEFEEEVLPPVATDVGAVEEIVYPDGKTVTTTQIGDIVTVKWRLNAVGGVAYGFTLVNQYKLGVVEFLTEYFVADNEAEFPSITAPLETQTGVKMSEAYGGALRVTYVSDKVVFEAPIDNVPQYKYLTFRFKLVGTYQSSAISNVPYGTVAEGLSVFLEKSFDITTLQDESGNFSSAKITAANTADAIHEQAGDGLHKTIVVSRWTSPISVTFNSGFKNGVRLRAEGDEAFPANNVAAPVAVGGYADVQYYAEAPVGRDVYGYIAGVSFNPIYAEFDEAATIAANPQLGDVTYTEGEIAASSHYIRIIKESDGSTVAFDVENPLVITLKFRITNATSSSLSFPAGASGQVFASVFLTEPSVRASELFDASGAFILLTNRTPQLNVKTAWANSVASGVALPVSPLTATLTRNAADLAAHPIVKPDETALVDITVTPKTDAYGFAVGLSILSGYVALEESTFAADNPDYADAINSGKLQLISTGFVPRVVWESDGETKVVEADEPLTLHVRIKVIRSNASAYTIQGIQTIPATILLDSELRFTGEGGLLDDAATISTAWSNAIIAAEKAGKASVAYISGGAPITPGFSAVITFGDVAGTAGTSNPEPITMPVTITNDSAKDVYGFEVGIIWSYLRRSEANGGPAYNSADYYLSQGVHIQLDPEATKAANPDVALEIADYYEAARTFQALRQMWVESDGETVVIPAGESLTLNLVFVATSGWKETLVSHTGYALENNILTLFTDPSLRVKESGEGLTRIDFLTAEINNAEIAGKLLKGTSIGPVTGTGLTEDKLTTDAQRAQLTQGRVTLVPAHPELKLGGNNYYEIKNAEELNTFAEIVNSGDNKINGAIVAEQGTPLTIEALPDFPGIGTDEYPFLGHLEGMDHIGQGTGNRTVIVNRTVTASSGASVGGLINVLGSGGTVDTLIVKGGVTVTGGVTLASRVLGRSASAEMNVGGVVGKSVGGTIGGITGDVNVTVADGVNANVGGIVGYLGKSDMPNIREAIYNNNAMFPYALSYDTNSGTVSGGTNVGGLVGLFAGAAGDDSTRNTIANSGNGGDVSSDAANANVGGVVGRVTGGVIKSSGNGRNLGYVTIIDPVTGRPVNDAARSYKLGEPGTISGDGSVGGVAGLADGDAALLNVYNIGAVTGGTAAGGVVGTLAGNASVEDSWHAAAEELSYNPNPIVGGAGSVGGIIGIVASDGVTVRNNFSLGAIASGGASVGGITGSATATPALYKGNYYETGTASGDALGAKSSGLSQISFKPTGGSNAPTGLFTYTPTEAPELGEDGYYLIRTVEEFIWFANTVNNNIDIPYTGVYGEGKYLNEINGRLMNDIDLTGETYDSIGTGSHSTSIPGIAGSSLISNRYEGTFDGNGYSITAVLKDWNGGGMVFNQLGAYAVVKNLTTRGSVSTTGYTAGGIVGGTYRTTRQLSNDVTDFEVVAESQIINCVNRASVTALASAGGIGGGGVYIDCVNYGDITSISGNAGGISASGVTFIRCKNFGKITAYRAAGGIAGLVATNGSFGTIASAVECENYGDVTSTIATPDNQFHGDDAAGGIFGASGSTNGSAPYEIIDCLNKGNISAPVYAGGIIGKASAGTSFLRGKITGNENYGNITLTYTGNQSMVVGSLAAGGIVGHTDLNTQGNSGYGTAVSNNYNAGTVTTVSGNGKISSIGNSGYNSNTGLPDEISSNNTTSVINGKETADSLGNVFVGAKEPPVTPKDPEFIEDIVTPSPDPSPEPSVTPEVSAEPGDNNGENNGSVGFVPSVPSATPAPNGNAVVTETSAEPSIEQPTVSAAPSEPKSEAVAPQVQPPRESGQPQVTPLIEDELPRIEEPAVPLAERPVDKAPARTVPVANVPELEIAAEQADDTQLPAAPDEPVTPEEVAAPTAPPANPALPDLIDTTPPELIRETVKNNAVVTVIAAVVAVGVLAAVGIALVRKRKRV